MRGSLHQFDAAITTTVASLPVWLHPLFLAVTTLGSPAATLTIGLIVAGWGWYYTNKRLAISGAIVWITLGVGSVIKLLVERARPMTEYTANLPLDTFSFPSGHASGSTIAYGLLAYIAWHTLPKPWSYITTITLAILIFLIGVSRIYLGAHFPSDVIAGWLLGGLALCISIFVMRQSYENNRR